MLGTFFSLLKGSIASPSLLVQPQGCSRSGGAERDAIGKKEDFDPPPSPHNPVQVHTGR